MANAEHKILFNGLTEKQFLVTAFETFKYLGWRIRFTSDAGVIAYTNNGEYAWNGEITVKLAQDDATIQCIATTNAFLDSGKSEQAVQRYISAFEQLKNIFPEDEADRKYKEYEKDFLPPYEDTLKPDIAPKFHFVGGFLSFFKPAKGYYITPILINLNILTFLIMVCSGVSVFEPDTQSMLSWGANSTVTTLGGQWWRLLSNCFLHFGIIHLLLNMYALFFVGLLLEPFLGRTKLITAYLLTGVAASLTSLWWHDYTVSAGASGAIFGLYGVFLALLSTNHIERSMRNGLLMNIGVFVVYNLVYGSFKGGIDNAAHVGGLLSGIWIGYAFVPALRRPDKKNLSLLTLSLVIGVTIICTVVACYTMSNSDRFVYQKRIQEFYGIETKALAVLKKQEYKPDEARILSLITSIGTWKSGINLIKDLDKLTLSDKLHRRNGLLIRYCQLRIESYEIMCAGIKRNNDADQPQLQNNNSQIKSVLDELNSLSR